MNSPYDRLIALREEHEKITDQIAGLLWRPRCVDELIAERNHLESRIEYWEEKIADWISD